jgi:hypothetical protein
MAREHVNELREPLDFELGRLRATPGALELLGNWPSLLELLARHSRGDWGDLTDDDKQANEAALTNGARLLSSYQTPAGKVWVITDATDDDGHRESTTVLLPEEY